MRLEEEIKSTKFESETHKAHINILFTAAWLRARVQPILKRAGLTHEQFNVLRILRGQLPNAICMMDIASRMLERNSNVTRIVEKLLTKGFCNRLKSEHDKREVRILITQAGTDLLSRIDADFKQENIHIGQLSVAEAQILNGFLDKLREEQ